MHYDSKSKYRAILRFRPAQKSNNFLPFVTFVHSFIASFSCVFKSCSKAVCTEMSQEHFITNFPIEFWTHKVLIQNSYVLIFLSVARWRVYLLIRSRLSCDLLSHVSECCVQLFLLCCVRLCMIECSRVWLDLSTYWCGFSVNSLFLCLKFLLISRNSQHFARYGGIFSGFWTT